MSKPKIVVLHMRELIYTAIFIFLILVLLILLFLMFRPHDASNTPDTETKTTFSSSADADSVGYQPGVYTASLILNNHYADIEVTLNTDQIDSIRLVNLGDSVTTAFPLVEPSLDELSEQICQKQSLDGITCSRENKYTSELLFQAIKTLWQKHKGRCCHRHPLLLSLFRCSLYRSIHKDCFSVKYYFIFQLNIYVIYNFSSSLCHRRTQASLGIRRSPLGDTATDPTFGPSGRQERLNCCAKNLQ